MTTSLARCTAIDLLEFIRDQHAGEPLSRFAAELLAEIESDRKVLRELAERAGAGCSGLKELTAWLGEKLSRLKLRRGAYRLADCRLVTLIPPIYRH